MIVNVSAMNIVPSRPPLPSRDDVKLRQAAGQLDLVHAEQAQREEDEQPAQDEVHDRVDAEPAEDRQQSDGRDRQHDDDGGAVDQGHRDRPMVLLLRLLEEEADGDRDHREDAGRDQRDGAPEDAGQDEARAGRRRLRRRS